MKSNYLSDAVSGITGLFAIINFEQLLSIIILILSILNILFNMILRIVYHIKNKNFDLITNELDHATNLLNNLNKKGEDKNVK